MTCNHDEGERSFAAVENGQCPICLRAQLTAALQEQERLKENETLLLRQLSDALTGGNAGTWDEILHAARRAEDAAAQITALQEENARLEAFADEYEQVVCNFNESTPKLYERIAALQAYVQHKPGCSANHCSECGFTRHNCQGLHGKAAWTPHPCTCGLSDLLTAPARGETRQGHSVETTPTEDAAIQEVLKERGIDWRPPNARQETRRDEGRKEANNV